MPRVAIRFWARVKNGPRFYLGTDFVDDLILEGLYGRFRDLYFPDQLSEASRRGVILDVGAHHGFYAIEAMFRYPLARLIAVEPNPTAMGYLRKNLEANLLLDRGQIVAAAVGREDGVAILFRSHDGSWSDSMCQSAESPASHFDQQEVRTISVESVLRYGKPDVVKCNAEGAEFVLFPALFNCNIFPELIILMGHPEYGNVDQLLCTFRERGYKIDDTCSTKRRLRVHCWRQPMHSENRA